MTAKTLGTLIRDVRSRVDEEREGYWKDYELRTWANEALRKSARECRCLHTQGTVATTANVASYTAPTNCIDLYQAVWKPSSSDARYPLEHKGRTAIAAVRGPNYAIQRNTPEMFITGGYPPSVTIELYPTPSAAGTLYIDYYKFPALLATHSATDDSTTIDWPEGWEDMIVDYMEYRAWLKRGAADRAAIAENNWRNAVAALTQIADNFVSSADEVYMDPWWWVNGPDGPM